MLHWSQFITILTTKDAPDDVFLFESAFSISGKYKYPICVEEGIRLLPFIIKNGRQTTLSSIQRPDLIMLEPDITRKARRELLAWIKSNPTLRSIWFVHSPIKAIMSMGQSNYQFIKSEVY